MIIRSVVALILTGCAYGAVAAQPKTADVNVTNPELAVTVTNPDLAVSVANEVLVRTVEGAKSPFKSLGTLFMNDGDLNATPNLVTVPAGKQLVVTYATLAIALPAGQTVGFRINAANNLAFSAVHDLQTSPSGPLTIGGLNTVVASAPVAMILTAGEVLSCWALRSSTSGTASGRCSVSGYYIDAP